MSVEPYSGGTVTPYDPSENLGLEDVGVGDIVIPRLNIVHKDGRFIDNLSKAEFDELDCILLGLVKQRIFWHDDTDDGDRPLCKSPDFDHGFPNVSEETPKDKRFPWDKSNFNPTDFPPGGPTSLNGLVTLPCASCVFKEWEKGDWKVPPCAEQHTYPLLYNSGTESEPIWTAAILTFQKTGIKPSRSYISSFAQSNTPMFTARTKITLSVLKRGTVEYSVPTFRKVGQTDSDLWGQYGDQYRSIRSFLRNPPRPTDDEYTPPEGFDNANTPAPSTPATVAVPDAPVAAAPQAPAPPVAPAATAPSPAPAVPKDDGLPF
jgi:hypothetical protein